MLGEPRWIDTTEATLYALTPGSLPPGYSTDATYYATWQAVEEALAGASENMTLWSARVLSTTTTTNWEKTELTR